MEEKVILVKEIRGKNYKLVSGPAKQDAYGIDLYCYGCAFAMMESCEVAGFTCSRYSYSGDNENCVWKEVQP